jgi:hypothetical protein
MIRSPPSAVNAAGQAVVPLATVEGVEGCINDTVQASVSKSLCLFRCFARRSLVRSRARPNVPKGVYYSGMEERKNVNVASRAVLSFFPTARPVREGVFHSEMRRGRK